MTALYGLVGRTTHDWLSYQGRVIVHHDKAEMAYLVPGTRVERITSDPGPIMQLRDHPDLASVVWPLTKEQFRCP